MDFIERLPRLKVYNSILVLVNWLRKYAYFLPLKYSYTSNDVGKVFVREVIRLHGFTRSIVSVPKPLLVKFL